MKVGLIEIGMNTNRHRRFPNLALMKLSAWHKTQSDQVVLDHPGEVTYISCIFSKHRRLAEALATRYGAAVIGGPGWDPAVTLPAEVQACRPDYSLYSLNYGLGRLTAGCPGDCPWCIVPTAEGGVSQTVAQVGDLVNGDFLVLLDSNILACSDWPDHFRGIRERALTVHFTQGLDIRLVNEFVARELSHLKVSNMGRTMSQFHFAWDRPENEPQVVAGIRELIRAGIRPKRLRFYMLVGYNTTFEQDYHRFRVLSDWGCEPFVMVYGYGSRLLRHFARWVNRMVYKSCAWERYRQYALGQLSLALPD